MLELLDRFSITLRLASRNQLAIMPLTRALNPNGYVFVPLVFLDLRDDHRCCCIEDMEFIGMERAAL